MLSMIDIIRDCTMNASLQNKRSAFVHLEDDTRKTVKLLLRYSTKEKYTHKTFACIVVTILVILRFADAEANITFKRDPKDYEVLEGNSVLLVCELETNNPIVINHKGIVIIENSVLSGSSSKYTLLPPTSNNACILKINQVERSDSGKYVCREGVLIIKQLNLKVYYRPNREPVCSSSNNSSTYFFEDMLGKEFEFNCTVEDGNPESEVHIFQELETKEILALDAVIVSGNEGGSPGKTLTFSSRFNSSFNNTKFFCDVRQNMPPTLEEYNYEQVCFHGPMTFLPNFTTAVSPRNVTIKEGESVTLICSSNVISAEKKWMTNFSEDVKWEIEENENNIRLTLSVLKGFEYNVIIVVCESSFEDRNSSTIGQINITRGKPNHVIAVIVPLSIITLIFIVVVIIVFYMCHLKSPTQCSSGGKDKDGEVGGKDELEEKTRTLLM